MADTNKREINPFEDGKTHINIYSKAKTELGKKLSNFAYSPFKHPIHGKFDSLEGYWYWIATGKKHEDLRNLYGYNAKKRGQEIIKEENTPKESEERFEKEDIENILEAIRCKFRQNKEILQMLIDSDLPLEHYYCWFGKNNDSYKIQVLDDYYWIVEEIERIRRICKEKHYNTKK